MVQETALNKNNTIRKPGRPKRIKRGKVRKTTIAHQKPDEHPATSLNKEKSDDQYKPHHRYKTRSKTSQEVNKKPEDKEGKSDNKGPEERSKMAVKRPEGKVTKRQRGRPRKAHVGVGGEPQNTSHVNSAYISSNFIAWISEKCDQGRKL